MWTIGLLDDPIQWGSRDPHSGRALQSTKIVHATIPVGELILVDTDSSLVSRVALADWVARLCAHNHPTVQTANIFELRLESLDRTISGRRRYRDTNVPFVLERTDVAVTRDNILHVYERCFVLSSANEEQLKQVITGQISTLIDFEKHRDAVRTHIAVCELQDRLRRELESSGKAVAFVANGSILPRSSGASSAPMSSPPAIPFQAPTNSPMQQTISVKMGKLCECLKNCLPATARINGESVELTGCIFRRGVSLIVGGGYHGKSTLLRCLAAGVYNKIPGDGREFCVTVHDAVTVRAEDGRYVNHCNISGFISNLPIPINTKAFTSNEASGSTSQAANVVEAIEMGASAFLVDEDISAANFMARDGRMRSLVMDESITPLLYRVNGLFHTHGISSIVVVGGVGDWLDVPDSVVLMDKYVCRDATAKARSVSRQFSRGHVQYAGRGVVHRLDWEKGGTPIPRKPSAKRDYSLKTTAVSLINGTDTISLQPTAPVSSTCNGDTMDLLPDDTEEDNYIDMSKCEQLMGRKPQLYGCGIGVVWLLQAAKHYPEIGLPDLLRKLDEEIDACGMSGLVPNDSPAWDALVETMGFCYRPRRFEVGQALTRWRQITMSEIDIEDDGSEARAKAEAERKRQELLEIWNSRRKNLHD